MSAKEASRAPSRAWGLTAFALAYVVFIYAPVVLLPVFSLNDSFIITFPLKGFTLRWYTQMTADHEMLRALSNTMKVGVAASLISTMLGLIAAKALTRGKLPGRDLMIGFTNLSMFIPDVVLGIALLLLVLSLNIKPALASVVAGHVLVCLPFALGVLMSRLEGFDASLEEASRDLGETAWMTFWRVTFPLVLPGIVASLLLTFIVSFDEFLVAFFLCGTDTTLPVYIFSQLRSPTKMPGVLALGATILIVSTIVTVIAEWVRDYGLPAVFRNRLGGRL
jgi:spermidine/putrescine transport system permease protein